MSASKLEQQSQQPQKDLFIFCLGTDTVFTPRPTSEKDPKDPTYKHYTHGETLSYAAQYLVQLLDETPQEVPAGDPCSFHSQSVYVFDGPNTRGTNVGDRIARVVGLCLEAAANGSTNVLFAAHSRGAVEVILALHELIKINSLLETSPEKELIDIILSPPSNSKNTHCSFSEAEFKNITNYDTVVNLDKKDLSEKLAVFSRNFNRFLIDPVPGGFYLGMFGWHDERFYKPLSLKYEEYYLLCHEMSELFEPIVSEGVQPIVLYGHHGTASGNIYGQQGEVAPEIDGNPANTGSVQQLMLCKLMRYLQHNSGLSMQLNPKAINLNHPTLDPLINDFYNRNPEEMEVELLKLYDEIYRNKPAFDYFAQNTHYSWLKRHPTANGTRYVHHNAYYNQIGIEQVAPVIKQGFVNTEHVLYYLQQNLGMSFSQIEDHLPSQLLTVLKTFLAKLFSDLAKNNQKDRVLLLLHEAEDKVVIISGLKSYVNLVCENYLRNHLEEQEKLALVNVLTDTFSLLDENSKIDTAKSLAAEFRALISGAIKDTALFHAQALLKQAENLSNFTNFFLDESNHFSTLLKTKVKHNPKFPKSFSSYINTQNDLTPKSVRQTLETLNEEKEALLRSWQPIEAEDQSFSMSELLGQEIMLYLEASNLEVEQLLTDLTHAYDGLYNLKYGIPKLAPLFQDGPILPDDFGTQIHFAEERIIELTVKVATRKKINKSLLPILVPSDIFFKELEQHVPDNLQELVLQLTEENEKLEQEKQHSQQQLTDQAEENTRIQQQLKLKEQQLTETEKIQHEQLTQLQSQLKAQEEETARVTKQAQVNYEAYIALQQQLESQQNATTIASRIGQQNYEAWFTLQQQYQQLELAHQQALAKIPNPETIAREQQALQQINQLHLAIAEAVEANPGSSGPSLQCAVLKATTIAEKIEIIQNSLERCEIHRKDFRCELMKHLNNALALGLPINAGWSKLHTIAFSRNTSKKEIIDNFMAKLREKMLPTQANIITPTATTAITTLEQPG